MHAYECGCKCERKTGFKFPETKLLTQTFSRKGDDQQSWSGDRPPHHFPSPHPTGMIAHRAEQEKTVNNQMQSNNGNIGELSNLLGFDSDQPPKPDKLVEIRQLP